MLSLESEMLYSFLVNTVDALMSHTHKEKTKGTNEEEKTNN